MRNNYIRYIVAMQLYFSRIRTAALSTGVATMSSLAQLDLQVQGTEEQRQLRCDDVKLIESGNARSKQLLAMLIESLTD